MFTKPAVLIHQGVILFQRVKSFFFFFFKKPSLSKTDTKIICHLRNLSIGKSLGLGFQITEMKQMCYLPLSNLKNTFLRRLSSPCVCLARVYQAFSKHSPPLRDYREGCCGNMKMRGRREGRTTVVVKWFESTRLKMVHPDYRTMLRGTQEAQPPPVGKPTSSTSDYCVSLPMPSTSQLSTE